MVVGHVRQELDWEDCDDLDENEDDVIGLTLFQPFTDRHQGESRCSFVCEANWDTSLHDSQLLNRPTPNNEHVLISVSLYLDLEQCIQPVVINKDICLSIQNRNDSTMMRSLRKIFTSNSPARSPDCYASFCIHEMMLCKTITTENTSTPLVLQDTSTTYVRGEEALGNWRPHGEQLISDHQDTLARLEYLAAVEDTRQLISLKDKITERANSDKESGGRTRRRERREKKKRNEAISKEQKMEEDVEYNKRQKELLLSCYERLNRGNILSRVRRDTILAATAATLEDEDDAVVLDESTREEMRSPPAAQLYSSSNSIDSTEEELDELLTPELLEFRLTPESVSKRGWIHFMNMETRSWERRFCMVQRPLLILYKGDKDPVPRWILNLSQTKISLTKPTNDKFGVFRLAKGNNIYYLQGSSSEDINSWLHAMNPLLAGTMRENCQFVGNITATQMFVATPTLKPTGYWGGSQVTQLFNSHSTVAELAWEGKGHTVLETILGWEVNYTSTRNRSKQEIMVPDWMITIHVT
eukprot:sb/3463799/